MSVALVKLLNTKGRFTRNVCVCGFFFSFRRETICDALAQNGLQIVLPKFVGSPQMHARWQDQIPYIPCVTNSPTPPLEMEISAWDLGLKV